MIALFARANHPRYVNDGKESSEWRYHGYSVILVFVSSESQLSALRDKLESDGLPEPFEGHANYEQGWYGGRFDLLAVLPGNRVLSTKKCLANIVRDERRRVSVGDNRFVGLYDAREILDA